MDKFINADKLIRQFVLSDLLKGIDDFIDTNNSEIIKIIESMPAADVVPIKRGKWISTDAHDDGSINPADFWFKPFECSACKKFIIFDIEKDYNYCPNCGAKMDAK